MRFLSVVLSLPTENATARQRAWRWLKSSGAAVLRDGVYLMPDRDDCARSLEALAADVRDSGGSAYVLHIDERDERFVELFDRSEGYATLLAEVGQVRAGLTASTAGDLLKQARKLRRSFANLTEIDFFPGEAQRQAETALSDLEAACARALSPDEPQAIEQDISLRQVREYQGRTWATRRRPWVDRLASAWLIRRHIDPEARILWLVSPADCPAQALGFDFDGATFTHVRGRVTFEVLAASFGLDAVPVSRLGLLVHYLDVGGVQPPEATGIEIVLLGLRAGISDDDALLAAAMGVFDALVKGFENSPTVS